MSVYRIYDAIIYQMKHLSVKLFISLAALLIVIITFFVLSQTNNFSFDDFTVNPYSTNKDMPVYLGILQKIGMVLWIATAVICFFTVYLKKDKKGFFMFAGFISSFFALDELVLLHNDIFPTIYKLNQNLVYIMYAVLVTIFLIKYRHRIFKSEFMLLYTSLFFLLIKIFIDGAQNFGIIEETKDSVIEDSSKLIGIFFWFYYFKRFAYFQVRSSKRPSLELVVEEKEGAD